MVCTLVLMYFGEARLGLTIKTNIITFSLLIQRYANFFKKTGLELVSPPNFVYDSSGKIFIMLYSINGPNFIFWLSLLLEILENICTIIFCCSDCDVINFEITLNLLIKPFF